MVLHDIGERLVEGCEHRRIRCDYSGLITVTTSKVLRSDDRDRLARVGSNQDNLTVVVGEIGVLNYPSEERPETKRFLRSLKIQDEVDAIYPSGLFYKIEAAQKLLGDGEGGLPDGGTPYLLQYPLDDISHLQSIREIALHGMLCKRLQVIGYRDITFHALAFLVVDLRVVFFFGSAGIADG